MVHYIFTPWRDRRELLAVRRQFYPRGAASFDNVFAADATENSAAAAARREAVARVTLWMQRGFCPHMVESTALLTAAILADSPIASSIAARAAYASAFARFVTGLLDGQQDRARKMSMHGLAQHMGLPPGFVELRHQVTHEGLPSLRRLRAASQQALAWIYDYYWGGVGGVEKTTEKDLPGKASLRKRLQRHIRDGTCFTPAYLARWGEVRVLAELEGLAELADDIDRARIRRLSRAVLQWGQTGQTGWRKAGARKRPRPTEAKAEKEAETAAAAPPPPPPPAWTMANLDLAAVRASLERNRQALQRVQAGDKTSMDVDIDVDGALAKHADGQGGNDKAVGVQGHADKSEANAVEEEHEDDDDDDEQEQQELPAKQPRWTRFAGAWTARPIGVV